MKTEIKHHVRHQQIQGLHHSTDLDLPRQPWDRPASCQATPVAPASPSDPTPGWRGSFTSGPSTVGFTSSPRRYWQDFRNWLSFRWASCTYSFSTPAPASPSTRTGTPTWGTTWRWCSTDWCRRRFHSSTVARVRTTCRHMRRPVCLVPTWLCPSVTEGSLWELGKEFGSVNTGIVLDLVRFWSQWTESSEIQSGLLNLRRVLWVDLSMISILLWGSWTDCEKIIREEKKISQFWLTKVADFPMLILTLIFSSNDCTNKNELLLFSLYFI